MLALADVCIVESLGVSPEIVASVVGVALPKYRGGPALHRIVLMETKMAAIEANGAGSTKVKGVHLKHCTVEQLQQQLHDAEVERVSPEVNTTLQWNHVLEWDSWCYPRAYYAGVVEFGV